MAASVQQINVVSADELESTVMSYIAQGFMISSRTPDSATLFKKKEFNIIWAVIGFFLCLLPLLVYCIVYATQNDQMVIVKVGPAGTSIEAGAPGGAHPAVGGQAGEVTWSEDRQWWWDGSRWRDTELELPPGTVLSEDERTWWDGTEWRPVPPPGEEGQAREGAPAPPTET